MEKLNVTELDLDLIKENIITYMSSKPEFTDYDFSGSGLSVIIDVLAYNTYYNAIYTNMIFNEGFLDTSVKRSNVISNASEIGYVPNSITAPMVTLDISLEASSVSTNTITITKGKTFSTNINGNVYSYVTIEDYVSNTPHENIVINAYEGTLLNQSFIYDDTSKFYIENINVDTNHISVTVDGEAFSLVDNILNIDSTSKVFFIQEVNGKVEIIFGNGILGLQPSINDVIEIEYLVTSGVMSNGAKSFSSTSSVSGFEVNINNTSSSSGGKDYESIQDIKFLSPLLFASQNRMVTKDDHIVLLKKKYSNIESLNVWGGEENTPAEYGTVFVSIKPNTGETLTSLEQSQVLNIVNKYGIMTTTYKYKDPEIVYIQPTVNIRYDATRSSKTSNDIKNLVTIGIESYGDNNLEKFNTYFKYSDFTSYVDTLDVSIISNLSSLEIRKSLNVTMNTNNIIAVDFNNKLNEGSIQTQYYHDIDYDIVKIVDNDGKLYTTIDGSSYKTQIGTIDYDTGTLNFTQLHVREYENSDTELQFTTTPSEFDIFPNRNQILFMDSVINVRVENV